MSDHLPECYQSEGKFDAMCICDRLRACEQRVRDELPPNGADATWYLLGQRKGVQAARDAVDRVASDMANWSSAETTGATSVMPDLNVDQWIWAQRGMHRALAAIDALKENP